MDIEKSKKIAELQTRFETKEKEHQIIILEKDNKIQRRQLIATIILVIIVFVITLLVLFLYRLQKKSNRKDKLLNKTEKQLIESEKQALNDRLFAEQAINKLQNEKLEQKSRQLSSYAMLVRNKNESLVMLKESLQEECDNNNLSKSALKNVQNLINQNIDLDKDWKQFKIHFEEVHNGFFERLTQKHINLTENEIRLCAYIKLNLTTSEIAKMQHVTLDAIKKSRQRLRKKLLISSETNLYDHISGL